MGFALWLERETAWAEGTHEYRPMGTAILSATDLFRARDFSPRRALREDRERDFAGFFASLVDLNDYLQAVSAKR